MPITIKNSAGGGVTLDSTTSSNETLNVNTPVFTGNVGVGVTPEAWLSTYKALQIGAGGCVTGSNDNSFVSLNGNAYLDSANSRYEYINSAYASQYQQYDGTHNFLVAPSGSADAAINWTTAMIIDNAGIVRKTYQPAFSAVAVQTNNPPINTWQTVNLTETFDNNADFNPSTDAFTAPVGGKYQLNGSIRVDNLPQACGYMYIKITTSNRGYYSIVSPPAFDSTPQYWGLAVSHLADMDAGDTATLSFYIAASSVSADIHSESRFSGFLAC